MPKTHAYPDHVFVVLHAPERGERGHVHYLELDQFIGADFLVTVHRLRRPAQQCANRRRRTGRCERSVNVRAVGVPEASTALCNRPPPRCD
jgi:hypothetical protein